MLYRGIHTVFFLYYLLLIINIFASWFPRLQRHPMMRIVERFTNPYLNIFRKVIPPIGGALDLSPLLAFVSLRLLENIVLRIFI